MAYVREELGRLLARPAATSRRLPPVLIEGETGTGKGLVASMIHSAGPRSAAAFVDVNCAAIPDTLLEAELFGFERGAFTDARQAKPGLFQVAHRGTIFLDEVSLMPDALQAKLLKALEDRAVRRLGATRAEPADVWVIAATSEHLPDAIRNRRFREDLYHRLAVVTLRLPPLRERGDDVALLARHYLSHVCREYGLPVRTLSADAVAALTQHSWPGNVRELANVMERVALLSDADVVSAAALRLPQLPRATVSARSAPRVDEQLAAVERERIEEALRLEDGNISRAAARLGLPRNTLRYRMVRHGLLDATDADSRKQRAPAIVTDTQRVTSGVRWERRRVTFLTAQLTAPRSVVEHETTALIEHIAAKVSGFGGRVTELGASFITAAFGLDAVENAARHAAHSAVAIQKTVARARPGGIAVGLALHTAEVPVARLEDRVELDVDGRREAQHVVDGLLAEVPGDAILVSPAAKPFLDRHFRVERVSTSANAAWRITGPAESQSSTTAFVSRQRELGMLEQLLAQAEQGRGEAVLVTGDPGIGKTRLLAEFRRRTDRRATWVRGSAVSFGGSMPFHPLIDLIRDAVAVQPGDGEDVIRVRVDAATAPLGEAFRPSVPFVRELMSIDTGDPSVARLDPKLRRAGIFEALARFLHGLSRQRPLVVVLEDVQWMDQATGEFLALMTETLVSGRVVLCATHRPGYTLPFALPPFGTHLTLSELSRDDSAAIASAVLGVQRLSSDLQQLVEEKSDGNPFLVEEVVRSLEERGLLVHHGDQADVRRPTAKLDVPDRVQEVLLGRIERLDRGAREVLAVAAVIGRQFSRRVLDRVLSATAPLDDVLRALRSAELIHSTSVWPEEIYVFRHAITQEVAYDAQGSAERTALHGRIGDAIESLYADRLSEQLGVLAYHFTRAEKWEKALTFLVGAAQRAERAFATREALALYDEALRASGHLAGGAGEPDTLIAIHEARARLYFVISEFEQSAAEGERILALARLTGDRAKEAAALATVGWAWLWGRNYEGAIRFSTEALAVAEPAGAIAVQGRALYTIGFGRAVTGGLDEGHTALRRAAEISGASGDTMNRSLALSAAGLLKNWSGDYVEATRLQAEGRALADEGGLLLPLLFSCFLHGLTLTGKGDYDQALTCFTDGLSLAERVGDEAIHHRLLNCLGWLYADLGDLDYAETLNDRSARVGRRRRDPGTQPNAELNLAEIFLSRGELERAQDQYDSVYRYWRNPPSQWMRFRYSIRMFAGMGTLALARGDLARARAHNAECLDLATRTGSRKNLVKSWRLAGEIARADRDLDRARQHLQTSRDLAAALGNPVQHWKSELTLAQLLQHAGREDDARQAIAGAWSVMQHVRRSLRDDRLRQVFEKNRDVVRVHQLVGA